MTPKVRVTRRAYDDLRQIARYTLRTWGRTQRDDYLRAIDQRFSWLAEGPERGRQRPDVAPGYRSFAQGAHIIFYLVRDGGIDIIGVPHQMMDIAAHFQPPTD